MNIQVINDILSLLHADNGPPIKIIGNEYIRSTIDKTTLQQALAANFAVAKGHNMIINPDAHAGYGAPIGCVIPSRDFIMPGPVGMDIKCSMSLIQFDIEYRDLMDKEIRRKLINNISHRIPTGCGSHKPPKAPKLDKPTILKVLREGASPDVCSLLDIPIEWTNRCETASHNFIGNPAERISFWQSKERAVIKSKLDQLCSYGSGNHFGELQKIEIVDKAIADMFDLKDGAVAVMSHCGSRGLGHNIATYWFDYLKEHFNKWRIPFPNNDNQLVYMPSDSDMAKDYLDDISLAGNFCIVNHLLINKMIVDAFIEVFGDVKYNFIYYISHNYVFKEDDVWMHRKGATRALPAGHDMLSGTMWESIGHPILLPGSPTGGSAVMVASSNAKGAEFSINHGAGRLLSRRAAGRQLNSNEVMVQLNDADILTNKKQYPLDEAPACYKDFNEVIQSVESFGSAKTVAKLKAMFVIKD